MDATYWRDLLRPEYQGRRFLIATEILAGAVGDVELLGEYGAQRPLVLAASRGVGPVPTADDAEVVVHEVSGGSTMAWLRSVERTWRHLPPDVLARVDAWDPEREAIVLPNFLFGDGDIAGRPTYGGRRPEWVELDDKTRIDAVWDRAGVARAPSAVVPLERDALAEASAALDWGRGTVWVADNRAGWHGAAELVRWIEDPAAAAPAYRFLADVADRVRVMPFLEGLPCSIHGIVFPEMVVVGPPIEMLVFREPGSGRFRYSGTGSFWEPESTRGGDMRASAERVGDFLATEYGYRGMFAMDGVMTTHGFLPTELNTRLGPGLAVAASVIDGLPLGALNRSLVAGADLDWRPAALERLLLDGIRGARAARALVFVDECPPEQVSVSFRLEAGLPVFAEPAESDVTVWWGPGPDRPILRAVFGPGAARPGPSIAPLVAKVLRVAAERFGVAIPPLDPAPPAT